MAAPININFVIHSNIKQFTAQLTAANTAANNINLGKNAGHFVAGMRQMASETKGLTTQSLDLSKALEKELQMFRKAEAGGIRYQRQIGQQRRQNLNMGEDNLWQTRSKEKQETFKRTEYGRDKAEKLSKKSVARSGINSG